MLCSCNNYTRINIIILDKVGVFAAGVRAIRPPLGEAESCSLKSKQTLTNLTLSDAIFFWGGGIWEGIFLFLWHLKPIIYGRDCERFSMQQSVGLQEQMFLILCDVFWGSRVVF